MDIFIVLIGIYLFQIGIHSMQGWLQGLPLQGIELKEKEVQKD